MSSRLYKGSFEIIAWAIKENKKGKFEGKTKFSEENKNER